MLHPNDEPFLVPPKVFRCTSFNPHVHELSPCAVKIFSQGIPIYKMVFKSYYHVCRHVFVTRDVPFHESLLYFISVNNNEQWNKPPLHVLSEAIIIDKVEGLVRDEFPPHSHAHH